jgi:hypothetical protein
MHKAELPNHCENMPMTLIKKGIYEFEYLAGFAFFTIRFSAFGLFCISSLIMRLIVTKTG